MNSHRIDLSFNYGYKWFGNETIRVKGWIIDENGKSVRDTELIAYFQGIDSTNAMKELLAKTGGHFAVVITTDNGLIAAVDRGRSIPLYYRTDRGVTEIADSGFLLSTNPADDKLNEFACLEYLAAGHVTGNKTLINSVFQIGAGEIATFNNQGVQLETYFNYLPTSNRNETFSALSEEFLNILEADYREIIEGLNGRTVVIPLSGGYDSRSIAAMFKRMGYTNVICYSFGKAENPEKSTSKAVADALGFKWLFVETTPAMIPQFAQGEEFLRYVDFAANAGSFYIIQDYFAIKHLHETNQIPTDAVIMPGHSGDTLGGSNFLELLSGTENRDEMVEKIIKHRYDLNPVPSNFINKIRSELVLQYGDYKNPAIWFDFWCMKEWNPKMFANGVRVYEFFGYSYFLPLWGKNMLAFFANLPLEHRIRKELYEFTLETRIFEPLGINLSPERRKRYSHKTTLFQHCKNCIKRIIPTTIKFKHFTFDPINSRLYCEELIRNGNERGFSIAANGTNSIKVQWYLNMIKQRIANTKK